MMSNLKPNELQFHNHVFSILDIVKLYKSLEEDQKHLVLINWATKHFIDPLLLKEEMSQIISDFESIGKSKY